MNKHTDTIAAIATPLGRGGVGIIRISGPKAAAMAMPLLGTLPPVRYAHYTPFLNADDSVLDEGIALYFEGPNSFTGEDVLELQGHGGPVIMNMLLERILSLGARLAKPGEFSERAFLNDKLDLTQAEAIASLIEATSQQAAKNAMNTLQGAFSERINSLLKKLIQIRTYVEAALDFPEEEIDFIRDSKLAEKLKNILKEFDELLKSAQQGLILQEGIRVVIAGKPNAGKSSLLNQLTERDSAIVTAIAGTTRDVLREHIQIDGIPLHIADTAGLHISHDPIEQEGIKRAEAEIAKANLVLIVQDATQADTAELDLEMLAPNTPTILIYNKTDLLNEAQRQALENNTASYPHVVISAKTGKGLSELKQAIKTLMGVVDIGDGQFVARERHLNALKRAREAVIQGENQLLDKKAPELLAADLLLAQEALNEITGRFTSDDLLGEIFSTFCIGK
jgi:tRNA modification GTPase